MLAPMSHPGNPLAPASTTDRVLLIPVKAFALAKGRLSDALGADQRASLAEQMATRLVEQQERLQVAICCDDADVAEWAASLGAATMWCPDTDLNGAVQTGLHEVRSLGYRFAAIAHSDLPFASSLHPLLGWSGVTLVPDRHRTGSNVIALPTAIDFRFSYGANSFQRHIAEAVRHRIGLRIVHDVNLGWDVDHPDDLAGLDDPTLPLLLESGPRD